MIFPGDEGRVDFDTVAELMSALANSERVRDCATLKSYEYLMGRAVGVADACSLEETRGAVQVSNASYKDMIRAHFMSTNFRNIQTEAL